MEWAKAIKDAVEYMERHITEDITMYDVASHVNISPFYFHKGFSICADTPSRNISGCAGWRLQERNFFPVTLQSWTLP